MAGHFSWRAAEKSCRGPRAQIGWPAVIPAHGVVQAPQCVFFIAAALAEFDASKDLLARIVGSLAVDRGVALDCVGRLRVVGL